MPIQEAKTNNFTPLGMQFKLIEPSIKDLVVACVTSPTGELFLLLIQGAVGVDYQSVVLRTDKKTHQTASGFGAPKMLQVCPSGFAKV